MSQQSANAAVAEAPLPLTFAQYLQQLRWDEVVELTMLSDSYYHLAGDAERQLMDSSVAAPPQSRTALLSNLCRGLLSSSTTRLLLHVGAGSYTVWVLTHPSVVVPCTVSVASGSGDGSTAAAARYIYQSSEGMQLLMQAEMPRVMVVLHAIAGVALLPLALYQKESIFYLMYRSRRDAGAAPRRGAEAARQHTRDTQLQRQRHRSCGTAAVLSALLMTAAGVGLRSYSAFATGGGRHPSVGATSQHRRGTGGVVDFGVAILYFALPWLVLAPITAASAKAASPSRRTVNPHVVHAIFGGLFIKAVVSVPIARVLGGLYQRWAGVHVQLPDAAAAAASTVTPRLRIAQQTEGELEKLYFTGIASAAAFGTVWAAVDIYRFFSNAYRLYRRSNQRKGASK